jgi:hypothetical protein
VQVVVFNDGSHIRSASANQLDIALDGIDERCAPCLVRKS